MSSTQSPVPICHRTLNPTSSLARIETTDATTRVETTYAFSSCIVPRCSLWVREVTQTDHMGTRRFIEGHHSASNRPTGRGVCAENVAREPYEVPFGV